MTLIGKAKKAVKAKEAELKGDAWLAEAKTDDGAWKDLQGWKEQYEPTPDAKKGQSIIQDKVKSKAMDSIFRKMQVGMSETITKTVLEVASAFMTKICQVGVNATVRVLPSINAIVLSYRFETKKTKRQLVYIRKQACSDLFDVLQPLVSSGLGTAVLSEEIRELVLSKKSHIRGIAKEKVQGMIGAAQAKMDVNIDEKMAAVESRVETKAQAVNDKAAHKLGLAPLDGSVAKKKLPDKDLVIEKKNDVAAQFGTMLEAMIVAKMETMDEHILTMIDQLLTNLVLIVKLHLDANHTGSEAKDKEDFLNQLINATRQQYDSFQTFIQQEVGKMVAMMKAFVDEKEEESE